MRKICSAATVDQISHGRLVFGIGAGGGAIRDSAGLALVHRELDANGIDVVRTSDAVDALAEACEIVKRMSTECEPFDYEGRWYRLRGAICEPKPVQRSGPPIMIGAGGERSLRVVAEHADIWNCPTRGDVDEFRRMSRILDDQCVAVGRDPGEIVRSVQLLVSSPTSPPTRDNTLPAVQDPAATRDLVLEFIDAGVRHVVLAPILRDIVRPVHWLADEIVRPVAEQIGQPV